jgi:hypothetical protein
MVAINLIHVGSLRKAFSYFLRRLSNFRRGDPNSHCARDQGLEFSFVKMVTLKMMQTHVRFGTEKARQIVFTNTIA